MAEHRAHIRWENEGADFLKRQYSRAHSWTFDGGITVPASAAPGNVPGPYALAEAVDPEEAFVASISSCHMLFFLFLAAKAGLDVRTYEDEAVGHMSPNERGLQWVSRVDLHPRVVLADGSVLSADAGAALHHQAHEECFIANSVRSEIRVVVAG